MSRSRSSAASTRNVFVLNTPTESSSTSSGTRKLSRITGRPSTRNGLPPRSPGTFSTTSTVSGAPPSRCLPSTSGSIAAPRLSRLAIHTTRTPSSISRPSVPVATDAVRQVAVAGGVQAGPIVGRAEQMPVGRQAQGDALGERVDPPAVERVAQRLADRIVRGVAGHQHQRQRGIGHGRPVLALRQPGVEECQPRADLDQRLDHAAHAGRHAAGQHDHGQLAAAERLQAEQLEPPTLVRRPIGERVDVLGQRRRHLPAHPVRRPVARQQVLGPAQQPAPVEPPVLQRRRRVRVERVELGGEISQGRRAVGGCRAR